MLSNEDDGAGSIKSSSIFTFCFIGEPKDESGIPPRNNLKELLPSYQPHRPHCWGIRECYFLWQSPAKKGIFSL